MLGELFHRRLGRHMLLIFAPSFDVDLLHHPFSLFWEDGLVYDVVHLRPFGLHNSCRLGELDLDQHQ
jgi:hypothetical protein